MLSRNKAKEMKRRASQRKATHEALGASLTLRAETRMAAAKSAKGKTQAALGSKGTKARRSPTAGAARLLGIR